MNILNNITFKLPFNSTFDVGSKKWEVDIKELNKNTASIKIFQTNFLDVEETIQVIDRDIPVEDINMEFLMEIFSSAYLTHLKEIMNYHDSDTNTIMDNSSFAIDGIYSKDIGKYPKYFGTNSEKDGSGRTFPV